MSSPGRPGRLNTPDRLVGDVKGQTGPREPAGSLSLSRSGLTRVADCVLKTSSLQVSLEEQFRGFEVPLGAECFRNGAFSRRVPFPVLVPGRKPHIRRPAFPLRQFAQPAVAGPQKQPHQVAASPDRLSQVKPHTCPFRTALVSHRRRFLKIGMITGSSNTQGSQNAAAGIKSHLRTSPRVG